MRGELTTSMERKNITNTAKLVISVWNIGLFALVWIGFYNQFTFDRYRVSGAIVSILIYAIIYLAMCNVASRRAAEEIILSGRVRVNGVKCTTLGTKVTEEDIVEVDGETLSLESKKYYIMLNILKLMLM